MSRLPNNSQLYSSYTIIDTKRFLENWQDVIDEKGLTFWFGFKDGSHLHLSGDLDWVVQTWSNHVGATVYIHYFKKLDVYRIGQIYDKNNAIQLRQAVFILKRDPITSSPIQESLNTILDTPQLSTPPLNNLKTPYTNPGKFTTNSRTYCSHHIRKPRNAWIIFRQEMMVKFRAQIGHLHTSEQSKVISKMWKKTPRHTKEFYTTLAHKEKADLLAQYPNYRVQPRKSSEIRKRIKNKYPSNLTTQNLNQWILDNGVQLRSAFSQDLQSKISFSSSDLINLEAKRSDTINIQSNNFRNSLPSRISPSKILLSGKARTQAQILAAHSELDIDTND